MSEADIKAAFVKLNSEFLPISLQILKERARQIELHGDGQLSQEKLFSILGEEVGEIARSINDKDGDNYRTELIQVAAVCIRMIQVHDRKLLDEKASNTIDPFHRLNVTLHPSSYL